MKTMTEFSAFHLRDAHTKAREIHAALQTDGRPAEELEQAQKEALAAYLAEKFKLEGERLELFLKALEVAETKPRELENLKRVVVYALAEGEKVPGNLLQRDSHAFGPEYLPSLRPAKQDRRDSGSKHGRGKDKERGKGRGKRRGDLKGRRPDGSDERRGANGRDGTSGPRRDGTSGPRREETSGPRREETSGPRREETSGPRPPRKDLPPGHVSVDQAARAVKSTGIRPVQRTPETATPAAAPSAPVSTETSSSDSSS